MYAHAQKTWRVCMRNIWALGVHGSYPLGDATLSECGRHSYSALLDTNVSYLGSHNPTPQGPGPSPESAGELVKVQDSAGREISNNQKLIMNNVHLYHNILTLLLLFSSSSLSRLTTPVLYVSIINKFCFYFFIFVMSFFKCTSI